MVDLFPLQSNLFFNVHLNSCFNLIGTPNSRLFNGLVAFTADSKYANLASGIVSSSLTRIKGCRLLAYVVKKQDEISRSSFIEILSHMLNSDWFSVRETAACLIVEMSASINRECSPCLGLSKLSPSFERTEIFNKLESDLLLNLDASQISIMYIFI